MLGTTRKQLKASVEDIVNTLTFAPDCTVTGHLHGGAPRLAAEVPKGYRLVSVNGHTTADSGDLKEVLLANAAVGVAVTIVVERTDQQAPRVPIEESVTFDGAASNVAAPDAGKVERLVKEMKSTPPPAPGAGKESKAAVATAAAASSAASTKRPPAAAASLSTGTPSPQSAASAGRHARTDSTAAAQSVSSSMSCSFSGSESSLADFCTVPLPKKNNHSESPPDLLEFEKMKLSMAGEDMVAKMLRATRDASETSVKHRLSAALAKVKPGRCVLCVTQDVNPIAELELLALASQRRLVAFDLGVKLRLRPKPAVLAAQFAEAMRTGAWFALINAQKSINTCSIFEELIADAHSRSLNGFDPNARILISLEPHPHFPKGLIHDAVVIKLVANFEGSSIFADSMATSMSRNRLVTADTLTASMLQTVNNTSFSASMTTAQAQQPPKRRVRINAAVDIVDIAPRDVVKVTSRDAPIDVSGSVALLKNFSGVPGDKFLCVRNAGEPGRFAVGSSLGNVYFLDSLGNSLLQAHAHNASIWDVGFNDKYSFATGCEDGTSASWKLSSAVLGAGADESVLVPTSATSLGADVYCVAYLKNMRPSPLIIGGLHNNLVIRPYVAPEGDARGDATPADEVHLVAIPLNAQVVDCLPSSSIVLVGGGDGSVSVIDVERVTSLGTLTEHTRKLPALTVRDDNQFFTGSFDSHILSWDLRVPGGVVGGAGGAEAAGPANAMTASTSHTLKLKNYVTGLDVDENHLAASVGENLYLWDIRKLGTVLGGYPQGWKGLSRGIKLQSDAHLVVTASPDGFARFWNFV